VIPMIAEKIMRTVGAPILVNGMRIRVRLVIGYSIYPKDSMEAVSLLSQADIAMRTMQLQQPVEES